MDDRDQLKRLYADVFASEPDADLLQMVDELHEAAERCRQGEPSAAVDEVIAQLVRQRREDPTPNGTVDHAVGLDTPAHSPEQASTPTRLRTGWFRQGLGMVAAVLVLVVVGGILAVTFGNQRQNQQDDLGGATTAMAAPGLPMTMTANGVAITLESVQADTSGTRFNFQVQLPDNLIPLSGGGGVGFNPAQDVAVNGTTPTMQEITDNGVMGHRMGETTTSFWFTLRRGAKTNQGLTVTLLQIHWVMGPGAIRAVQGPWTFHVAANMLANQAPPTPNNSGIYDQLTVAQAQQLASFPIIEPNPLPDGLTRLDLSTSAFAIGSTGSAKSNYIRLYYGTTGVPRHIVTVDETTIAGAQPIVKDGSLIFIDASGRTNTLPVTNAFETTVSIRGEMVTKLEMTDSTGGHRVYYTWQESGVSFTSYADPNAAAGETLLQQVISSMIDQGSASATPTWGPTQL